MEACMDNLLTVSDVKRMFTASNYRKGQSYFQQGRVRDLAYDSDYATWTATVVGSKRYQVVVEEVEYDYDLKCSCPAFDMYDAECKHVVAVMLKIQETEARRGESSSSHDSFLQKRQEELKRRQEEAHRLQQERLEAYVKQQTDSFISTFTHLQQRDRGEEALVKKTALTVEWICKISSGPYTHRKLIYLEMKVGDKRTYVVKNLKEFIKATRLKNQYPFTKNFTYDPTEFTFTVEDQELIELLHDSIKYEEMYREMRSSYYSYESASDDRIVTISPIQADEVLEKLAARGVRLQSGGTDYHQLHFHKGKLPFTFQLDKGNKEPYQLDVSEIMFIDFFEIYGYVVKGNTIYKLSPIQQTLVKDLKKLVQATSTPILPISHEQIEPLLSTVAPIMDEVGKLEITEGISNKIMKYPLKATMYVDIVDDQIQVSLEYRYGDYTIKPFQHQNDSTVDDQPIIIRDTQKEQVIMNIVESSSLKSDGKILHTNGEEEMFDFLYETLPRFEEKVEVLLTNKVKSILIPADYTPATNVNVDSSGNWLEVNFSVEGIFYCV